MNGCNKMFLALLVVSAVMSRSAAANGVGENFSSQFATTADMTNRAFLEDLRQRKQSGYFAAPIYNTIIQGLLNFNCNVAGSANGSIGASSNVASSSSTTGNGSRALGNDSQNAFDLFGFPSNFDPENSQTINGKVVVGSNGNVETVVFGNNFLLFPVSTYETGMRY